MPGPNLSRGAVIHSILSEKNQQLNKFESTPTYTTLEVIGPSNFQKNVNGISEDEFILNEKQKSMLNVSESNANPSNMNEENENTLTYKTLEVLIPSNFEEVIEVQNDPVLHEIEQFDHAEILNTTVIPEEDQQEEEKGEQQDEEEKDLGLTKRGTKRARKKISTTQKEYKTESKN